VIEDDEPTVVNNLYELMRMEIPPLDLETSSWADTPPLCAISIEINLKIGANSANVYNWRSTVEGRVPPCHRQSAD